MREMKDSGIVWIGEIPANWTTVQTLHVLSMPITDGPHTTPELYEEGIPFVSAEAVSFGKGSIDFEHIRGFISEEFYKECCKKYIPQKDDIYMIKSGATTGMVSIVDTDEVFTIWSPLAVFRCNQSKMLPKYMFYSLLADCFQKQVQQAWSYGTQQNIGMRVLEHLKLCFPSLKEQKVIAEYLGQKCANINIILEKSRASIEEYEKLKQAVITQAVTKGVRGDREMKDSGIEWIGEIPYNWSVIKATRIIDSTQNGLTRRDLEKSNGQIVLKLKNITAEGKITYEEVNKIKLTDNEIETYSLKDGDFLFVRVNGSKNLVGKCAIYQATAETVAYNDHIIRVRLNSLCDKHYFHWYLMSYAGKTEIDLHTSTAAGQYTISGDGLRELYVVLPPNCEQIEIANYLKEKCDEIDDMIVKKEQYLTEIENYKKSLIYEYVTGKKEVPFESVD